MGDPGKTISPTLSLVEATSLRPVAEPVLIAELASLKRLEIDEGDGASQADLEIKGVLGTGGMGRVELGRQPAFGREVAVKRVRPDRYCADAVTALLRESRFTGSLEHPNIVPVHQLGLDGAGRPVLVMKRVEGASWRSLARGFSLERNLDVLRHVCNAIEFAHRRGVLHRDLKLDNVMVGELGEVYVVDWGVAIDLSAAARGHDFAGTPAYMAPEMIEPSSPLDARTDVYLLGTMLHEVLTGSVRHAGALMEEVIALARASAPFDYGAEVPAELAALCNASCAAAPAARPSSALAFSEAIAEYSKHRGSIELAERVEKRRHELDTAVREQAPAETVRTLITETTFGFRQALEVWPGNPLALAGLQASGEAAVAFEVEQRNVAGAEAALAALPAPRRELQAKVRALRDALSAEAGELEALRGETDKVAGARSRSLIGAASSLAAGTVALVLSWMGVAVSYPSVLALVGGLLLVTMALFAIRRREALVNVGSRQHMVASLSMITAIFVTDAMAMYLDAPLRFVLVADAMLPTLGLFVLSLWSSRWIAFSAGVTFCGAFVFLAGPADLMTSTAVFLGMFSLSQFIRSRYAES